MLGPGGQLVGIVWAVNREVRDGWMMTGLLPIDHGTILTLSLVSLTEDGVERLLKDLFFVEERHIVSNDKLHALKWVGDARSLVKEYNHRAMQGRHNL